MQITPRFKYVEGGIEKQLARLADALGRIAEGSADVGVKCKEE